MVIDMCFNFEDCFGGEEEKLQLEIREHEPYPLLQSFRRKLPRLILKFSVLRVSESAVYTKIMRLE